jgi:hypothetical protein
MKFIKLTTLALAGVLTFAACKYEEGPKISFRAKRDRVANEWRVKSYTYDGQDQLNRVVDPEFNFELLFNLYRTGAYGIEVVKKETDQDGNVKYITNHTALKDPSNKTGIGFQFCCWPEYQGYLANLPSHIKYVMPGGEWTFDRGHTKIQVKPELSYDNQEVQLQKNTIDWGIVMLREKEMKVKGRDENNIEWVMVFERINDEPYFY